MKQTRNEEIANSLTHGAGLLLAVVGTGVLTHQAWTIGDPWRLATYTVFGLTMILLYGASTLYHTTSIFSERAWTKIFDHISIYYLIAGTYTPVTLVAMRGNGGWTIFTIIWALALAGTVYKLFFTGRFKVISTAIYLFMGWLAVFAMVPLIQSVSGGTFAWILAGGLSYTVGVLFYAWRRLPFGHAIWHLFVLGGTANHFVAVLSL